VAEFPVAENRSVDEEIDGTFEAALSFSANGQSPRRGEAAETKHLIASVPTYSLRLYLGFLRGKIVVTYQSVA